jgi:hypothetical protein
MAALHALFKENDGILKKHHFFLKGPAYSPVYGFKVAF